MAFKAPFNYIGNKYRIINEITSLFPEEINNFVDLFCGGGDVSINTRACHIYANDINYHVIDIIQAIQNRPITEILKYIDNTIAEWGLSKSSKENYLRFRNHYNSSHSKNPIDLYILMCFSFNFQFRFNSKHEYNNPFGQNRSHFSPNMRSNLITYSQLIHNIRFSSLDFRQFDFDMLHNGDLLYADPPYLLSCGSYNDGKRGFNGWGIGDDLKLMEILQGLNDKGVNFALSNVIEHKGRQHRYLIDWTAKNKFIIHDININYNNCNYQNKNKTNNTREVLITNY